MPSTLSAGLSTARSRLGSADREFDCCDTTFLVRVEGVRAGAAADAAVRRARELEGRLNAFDSQSAVAELNETGRVADRHVAAVVRRALAYGERTDGAFDVRHGEFEHDLKAYIRGETAAPPAPAAGSDATTNDSGDATDSASESDAATLADDDPTVTVDRDVVTTTAPLDLNGLAKGYVVDRSAEALRGAGRRGFVSGGGDISRPTGLVGVEDPRGGDAPLAVLDTDWNVASSGGYRRRRGGVDHVYDPRTGRAGARHDAVTVVAERDCTEADALATTLSVLSLDEALALAADWPGVEALVVRDGDRHATDGFDAHVYDD